MYNENEPIPYQAQHNYHSHQSIKARREETYLELHIAGVMAVATLLLTIVGIVVSFR